MSEHNATTCEGVEVKLHPFLTFAPNGDAWRFGRFTPVKEPVVSEMNWHQRQSVCVLARGSEALSPGPYVVTLPYTESVETGSHLNEIFL